MRLTDQLVSVDLRQEATEEDGLVALACLGALSDEERELLMLASWEGLTSAEIGRVLGCSPTAARIRLHCARSRLKASIATFTEPEKRQGTVRHAPGGPAIDRCAPKEA